MQVASTLLSHDLEYIWQIYKMEYIYKSLLKKITLGVVEFLIKYVQSEYRT